MHSKILALGFILTLSINSDISAQTSNEESNKKYFVGSTAFILGNFIPDDPNPPDFVQLNLGYRITPKDAISLELKTWRYSWSLGIPYGDSFEAADEKFPGYIREFGFALVYQKFLWKGLYASVHVMNAWQSFFDENSTKIDNGFQIFNTYRLGYHIDFFNDKFFIEPSIAITHRPYHTEMPDSFKAYDDKWSKFFIGEPGLHFGVKF